MSDPEDMNNLVKMMVPAVAILLAGAGQASAVDLTVKPGESISLLNATLFYPDDCRTGRAHVVIVKKPQHGSLSTASSSFDPKDANGGHGWFTNRCYGRQLKSTRYVYRSAPGFRGEDQVILRHSGGDNGDSVYRYRITVK